MNRNQKQVLYNEKYKDIPIDFFERLDYMCDKYKLSQSKMMEILDKRDSMIDNLYLYDYQIIQLLEEPEGSKRPRFRLVNRKNFTEYRGNKEWKNRKFELKYCGGDKRSPANSSFEEGCECTKI